MARAIRQPGAIETLEEAVRLLREAPIETLARHAIGTIPFAMSLLLFWYDMSRPRSGGALHLRDSLLLSALLVWMNCWRAVFAGRLRRQLSGAPDTPWNRRRAWRLITSQAWLSSLKLVILPVALLAAVPLAWVVAFFRNASVLADREDLDLPALIEKSRRLARFEPRRHWLILALLAFLYLAVLLNVVVTLALLPQLARILTGSESVFTRGGVYFMLNPLFALLALLLTWIAFDPLVQAVYCVRVFRGESLETGEDVRAGLREILRRSAAIAALVCILITPGFADVRPADLDAAIQETLRSPEYDWRLDLPQTQNSKEKPWIVRMTERIAAGAKKMTRTAVEWLRRLLQWIQGITPPSPGDAGQPPSKGLRWSVAALVAALLVALAGAGVWLYKTRRVRPAPVIAASTALLSLPDDAVLASELPEESWFALADACMEKGDPRSALRALYLGNLAWLARDGWLAIHLGKTDREYERELRRKTRATPEVSALFAANVFSFQRAWYGRHPVGEEDIHDFRQRIGNMKNYLKPAEAAA